MGQHTFLFSEIIKLLKEELIQNSRFNRNLILGIIANIPTPLIFIPYVTQVITIILVLFHTKNYPWHMINLKNSEPHEKAKLLGIPVVYLGFIVSIIVLQFIWIPFMTQTFTITLLGIYLLLLSRRKYLK